MASKLHLFQFQFSIRVDAFYSLNFGLSASIVFGARLSEENEYRLLSLALSPSRSVFYAFARYLSETRYSGRRNILKPNRKHDSKQLINSAKADDRNSILSSEQSQAQAKIFAEFKSARLGPPFITSRHCILLAVCFFFPSFVTRLTA